MTASVKGILDRQKSWESDGAKTSRCKVMNVKRLAPVKNILQAFVVSDLWCID